MTASESFQFLNTFLAICTSPTNYTCSKTVQRFSGEGLYENNSLWDWVCRISNRCLLS